MRRRDLQRGDSGGRSPELTRSEVVVDDAVGRGVEIGVGRIGEVGIVGSAETVETIGADIG